MRALLLTGLCLLTVAAPVRAQWQLEAQAGRMRSALDPANTSSQSFVVGLRFDQINSSFRISAGVPTSSDDALWGAVAGAHRFAYRRGAFIAGLDAAAHAFLLHDRVERLGDVGGPLSGGGLAPDASLSGSAAAVQGMPLIGLETLHLQAHVRGGVSFFTSKFGEQQRDRTVRLADAQISWLPTSSFAIMPALRYYDADENDYTFAGVTLLAGNESGSIWGSTGRWLELEQQDVTWAAGANLRVHDRVTLSASGRGDVLDPLYMTPAQTAWSIGVSYRLSGPAPTQAPIAAIYQAGQAVIRLPIAKAPTAPRVAGDFTQWQPRPMRRSGDEWIYTVTLAPGVYNYAFVDDRGEWFVPEEHPGRKQDGMGGEVAVLVVH
ncbi:MAG TPA: glycogen-binding domain-containing protein [Longimicrobiales bacterium]|nr:glycogen-binding domain-containing protein [Longimicrobiales bacterium]